MVVGAPESEMRIMAMWLMKKSRRLMFVNNSIKDHICRFRFPILVIYISQVIFSIPE